MVYVEICFSLLCYRTDHDRRSCVAGVNSEQHDDCWRRSAFIVTGSDRCAAAPWRVRLPRKRGSRCTSTFHHSVVRDLKSLMPCRSNIWLFLPIEFCNSPPSHTLLVVCFDVACVADYRADAYVTASRREWDVQAELQRKREAAAVSVQLTTAVTAVRSGHQTFFHTAVLFLQCRNYYCAAFFIHLGHVSVAGSVRRRGAVCPVASAVRRCYRREGKGSQDFASRLLARAVTVSILYDFTM